MEQELHLFVRDSLENSEVARMCEICFTRSEIDGKPFYQAVTKTNDILSALIESEAILIVITPAETDS